MRDGSLPRLQPSLAVQRANAAAAAIARMGAAGNGWPLMNQADLAAADSAESDGIEQAQAATADLAELEGAESLIAAF